MENPPLFSILIPVYNGAEFLPSALESLIAQQNSYREPFEVIALDDGSCDDSLIILNEAKKRLPLKILNGTKKGNWVATTNKGILQAKGRFISFLHQDDQYEPNRLATCAEFFRGNPETELLIHPVHFISATGKHLGDWSPPLRPGKIDPIEAVSALLLQNNISVPGCVFRRTLVEQIGPMDETLRYTADWEFWLRILTREGIRADYLPQKLSSFRVHAGSQTIGFASKIQEYRTNLETVVDRFLPWLQKQPNLSDHSLQSIQKRAKFGIQTNILLAQMASRSKQKNIREFCRALVTLSPPQFFSYFSISRIIPRIFARLRAGL